MKISVQFMPEKNDIPDMEIAQGAICLDVLNKLGLSPDAHIVTRKGEPIPIDERLKDGEQIEIIKVVSGG
jgi:sulfur carrier protein ThiS